MSRNIGPVCRLCRRAGEKLFLKGDRCMTPKCAIERRNTPPGAHGAGRRRRLSEHGMQMREKNRARAIYGITESQFRKNFDEAARKPGVTGQLLLQLLERRLDNAVCRLGFASSRAQARQLVRHGHITVNGKKLSIPSYLVNVGEVIGWVESSKALDVYKAVAGAAQRQAIPKWLILDVAAVTGKIHALPEPADMDLKIEERMIVEYYAR